MKTKKIAIITGSLRKDSYGKKFANALIGLAPETLKLETVDISELPYYNEDLENDVPVQWKKFRDTMKTYDGVIFVTPEYNRSIPAVIKNAIDVGSRPYGQNAWNGKPGAILSYSLGPIAGFGANHHLRQVLSCVNVLVLAQPEVYIGNVMQLFDESGKLINDSTKDFLLTVMNEYDKLATKLIHTI